MKNALLAFLWTMAEKLLAQLAQNLWEATWEQIFLAVKWAEEKWEGGAIKREWVIEQVIAFIETKASIGWIHRQIIRLFVGQVVDAIIELVNEELGHDWVKRVEELEQFLAGKFPFIK